MILWTATTPIFLLKNDRTATANFSQNIVALVNQAYRLQHIFTQICELNLGQILFRTIMVNVFPKQCRISQSGIYVGCNSILPKYVS
jgi:hypothetical protein